MSSLSPTRTCQLVFLCTFGIVLLLYYVTQTTKSIQIGANDDTFCLYCKVSGRNGSNNTLFAQITKVENGKTEQITLLDTLPRFIANLFYHDGVSFSPVKSGKFPPTPRLYVKPLGRLGNCIYVALSGFALARQSDHRFVLDDGFSHFKNIFPHLNVTYEPIPDGAVTVHERSYASFTSDLEIQISNKDTLADGYYQSYKYFKQFNEELKEEFRFSDEIYEAANSMLARATAFGHKLHGSDVELTYIAVHVRRNDMTASDKVALGYNVADVEYIQKAMYYFRHRYRHVVFVVTTDDSLWCIQNILGPDVWMQTQQVADFLDMALLSLCNHTIMTVGTYGWVAAWMAGGEVTYYEPAVNYSLDIGRGFCAADFYPPTWIPLSIYTYQEIPYLVQQQTAYSFHRPCKAIRNVPPIGEMLKANIGLRQPSIHSGSTSRSAPVPAYKTRLSNRVQNASTNQDNSYVKRDMTIVALGQKPTMDMFPPRRNTTNTIEGDSAPLARAPAVESRMPVKSPSTVFTGTGTNASYPNGIQNHTSSNGSSVLTNNNTQGSLAHSIPISNDANAGKNDGKSRHDIGPRSKARIKTDEITRFMDGKFDSPQVLPANPPREPSASTLSRLSSVRRVQRTYSEVKSDKLESNRASLQPMNGGLTIPIQIPADSYTQRAIKQPNSGVSP